MTGRPTRSIHGASRFSLAHAGGQIRFAGRCGVALAAALLALALACPAAVQAETPAGPIRIGTSVSRTGKYVEPSQMIHDAYQLWVRQINDQGGLLARPVELIVYDDESRLEKVQENYNRLLHQDRVDLLFAPYGTPLTLAASEISEGSGYVMLASAAAGEILFRRGQRHIFGVYAPASRFFIGFLDLLARHGLHSVAIIYEHSAFHEEVAEGAEAWARRFRLDPVFHRAFAPDGQDLPKALGDLLQRQPLPDALIFSAYSPDCYRMFEILSAHNARPRVIAQTIAPIHPDFFAQVGPAAEGVFGPSQWEPDERIPFPGTQRFIQDFQTATGRMPSYHAASSYAACQILEKAITYTHSLNQEMLREYIASMDSVTVLGRFKVDPSGMQIGHNPLLIQWQEGTKEIVYPSKLQTAKPRF